LQASTVPQSAAEKQLVLLEGTQLAASPVPEPEQLRLREHCPWLMHWPLAHWLSFVHWQLTPRESHVPVEQT
jgi:hypothetical protein